MACSDIDSQLEESKSLLKFNWNPLKIDGKSFSFKSNFNDDKSTIELFLFDLNSLNMYFFKQNQEQIMNSFKEFNPSLEAPLEKIVSHIEENFTTLCQSNDKLFTIDESESEKRVLKVNLNSKLSGVKFRWHFRFNQLDSSLLREHVLLPLMFSCAEYQLREHELIRLIQAKDKELDDYKSQGVKLSRKHLNTEVFNAEAFDDNFKKEVKDVSENPEKSLYTPLAHKISQFAISKYMRQLFKSKTTTTTTTTTTNTTSNESNEQKTSQSVKLDSNQAEKVISLSQKESRIKELENKIKDEEEKSAKKIAKKKKLF